MNGTGSRTQRVGATADRRVDAPVEPVDGAVFRRVVGNFASGVVVITTSEGGRRFGATVSAVTSLSLDPPMMLVCLHAGSSTQEAVRRRGVFAVNVLAEHQSALAGLFARPGDAGADKFEGVPVHDGRTGVPVLDDTLAVIECSVQSTVMGGTHRVFLARVVHAEATEGSPLAYFRGSMGKLDMEQDSAAYAALRSMVLTRVLGPRTVLEVPTIAAQLGASPSSVYYALTRLVGEDLVVRDPDRGHLVRPLDAADSDDAHDAKLAIELGTADLTVGRLDDAELAEFHRLADATALPVTDGRIADVDSFIRANAAFHEYPIRVSGIDTLLRAYERLSLPDMMSRALSRGMDVSDDLIDDHRRLVDAYRSADLAGAKRIITAHNERAKATQRAGIEIAGGAV